MQIQRTKLNAIAALLLLIASASHLSAAPALSVVGNDYIFPNKVEVLPAKLSDFKDLQINSFVTSDGVKLTYWKAGSGKPLIFVPGWTGNGAQYINLMYLLRDHYHVYVLDPRNQGLSQRGDYGNRISRFAVDLKEFVDHLGLQSADFCGHSMGSSILWSYIDQYGTSTIHKAVFVDEPISITARSGWTDEEKKQYDVMVENPADLVRMMTEFLLPSSGSFNKDDGPKFAFLGQSTPSFVNSEAFANEVVKNDPAYMLKVLYDHAADDWRDVITHKINVPTAIFSGDLSPNLPIQRWEHEHISGSKLFVYSKEEGGDHLLMSRNPGKFSHDLQSFLESGGDEPMNSQSDSGIEVRELLHTNDSWNGAAYGTYPAGIAEPVVAKITIPANKELTWHSHPMPSFAYVLSGEITVEDNKGNKKHFTAGEVMAETVHTAHHGIVGDQPATFIVFYARTKGMPLSQPASRPTK
jgi:pimeloyl-ACP methyl ester carboxylesterase/quercetin dioxygenase-like cupin family protein